MRDDGDLLAAWRGGDLAAGNELVTRHWDAVSRFFRSKIGDDGADLISQTLLALVEGKEPVEDVRAYIFTVARRRLVDHFRRVSRTPELDPALSSIADLRTGVETALDRGRARDVLRDALARIPLDDQIALELAYLEGMPGRDVARVLGIGENTLRSRLARAKQRVRAALTDLGASNRQSESAVHPRPGSVIPSEVRAGRPVGLERRLERRQRARVGDDHADLAVVISEVSDRFSDPT